MKVGILLTTSPENPDGHLVASLARRLREAGDEVVLFLMEDGLYHVLQPGEGASPPSPLAELLREGIEVSLCSVNASMRGLSQDQMLPGVQFRSQYDLARLVGACDRFLAFGARS